MVTKTLPSCTESFLMTTPVTVSPNSAHKQTTQRTDMVTKTLPSCTESFLMTTPVTVSPNSAHKQTTHRTDMVTKNQMPPKATLTGSLDEAR